jgi:hypothetical protein
MSSEHVLENISHHIHTAMYNTTSAQDRHRRNPAHYLWSWSPLARSCTYIVRSSTQINPWFPQALRHGIVWDEIGFREPRVSADWAMTRHLQCGATRFVFIQFLFIFFSWVWPPAVLCRGVLCRGMPCCIEACRVAPLGLIEKPVDMSGFFELPWIWCSRLWRPTKVRPKPQNNSKACPEITRTTQKLTLVPRRQVKHRWKTCPWPTGQLKSPPGGNQDTSKVFPHVAIDAIMHWKMKIYL